MGGTAGPNHSHFVSQTVSLPLSLLVPFLPGVHVIVTLEPEADSDSSR